jgi:phosphatidylinositol alpha-mannosyltransferase
MHDPLSVALVSPYGLDRFGGVRSHIQGLGEALVDLGHTVNVIAPGDDGTLGSLGVTGCGRTRMVRFGGTHFDVAWASRAAIRRALAGQPEVVHLHTPWNPALPLQVAASFRGPRVATFHDVAGEKTPAWARAAMPMASMLIRRAFLDETIAVSPSVAAYLGSGTHTLIPNGVTVPPAHAAHPHEYAVGGTSRPLLVFVGRLEPRKGLASLLRALALVHEPRPDVAILGDGPLREEMEALAHALGLARVTFCGALNEHSKWEYLRRATCLVAPSLYGESFGIVLLEAMAAGCIPIAADNVGYHDVLEGGGESLLYPPGNEKALAARIARALNDRAWHGAMRQWASQRWPAVMWSTLAERVVTTYRSAILRAAA